MTWWDKCSFALGCCYSSVSKALPFIYKTCTVDFNQGSGEELVLGFFSLPLPDEFHTQEHKHDSCMAYNHRLKKISCDIYSVFDSVIGEIEWKWANGGSSLASIVALFVTLKNCFSNMRLFLSSKIKQNTLNMVGIQQMLIRNTVICWSRLWWQTIKTLITGMKWLQYIRFM